MKAMGIDIGTTTVCGIVIDIQSGEVNDVKTLSNHTAMKGAEYEYLQDPDRIFRLVQGIYQDFLEHYGDICCIGLTGQMHGILFTNESGMAVSPLYTWQDESGNEKLPGGESYAKHLSGLTGYAMSTGYGLTTLYYKTEQKQIPEDTAYICTIPDYVAMRLTGKNIPVITPSMGASLGCFNLKKREFDTAKIQEAGMDCSYLPVCRDGYVIVGNTGEGIPVAAAIGDNQASFLGSVCGSKDSVLVNVGTGSQISTGVDFNELMNSELPDSEIQEKEKNPDISESGEVELRPLIGDACILVGSSLCGGRAYAALEQFFERTVEAMTGKKPGRLYEKMAELLTDRQEILSEATDAKPNSRGCATDEMRKAARREETKKDEKLTADTRFCGTRTNPFLTGSFQNLTLNNFTPEAMTKAVLWGIAEELTGMHKEMLHMGAKRPTALVGSGNGLRMNPFLKRIFEEIYQLPMQLPCHKEEAAFGAALYAMCAAGIKKNMEDAQKLIRWDRGQFYCPTI